MTLCHLVCVLGLLVLGTSAQYSYYSYEDFFNPYALEDKFIVECGDPQNQKMHVLFRGDAMKVYGPNNPSCEAEEVEPGHFEIEDARGHPYCEPNKDSVMDVYTLELVIQKTTVRRYDDPIHLVSCNYETGKNFQSESKGADDSALERIPDISHAGPESTSTFTLSLRDVRNNDVDQIKIGTYVQLVATMIPGGSDMSFRVWNCRAFSNSSGLFAEHYILLEGCGDGNVIKADRGFLTTNTNKEAQGGGIIRMARSVFFRAFSLLGSESVKFACDFIVTTDSTGDGKSCKRSVRRKRRAIGDGSLPMLESEEITLLPAFDPADKDNVITYYVESENNVPIESRSFADISEPQNTAIKQMEDTHSGQSQTPSVLGQPIVIGLLVGLFFLVILVIVVIAVSVVRFSGIAATRGYTKAVVVESPMETSLISHRVHNLPTFGK